MKKRDVFTAVLVAATVGLFLLRIGLGAPAARSLGYVAVPWLVGLVVAALTRAFSRGAAPGKFRNSLEGAACVMLVLLFLVTLVVGPGAT